MQLKGRWPLLPAMKMNPDLRESVTIIYSSFPLIGSQTQNKTSCHGALLWQQLLIQGMEVNLVGPMNLKERNFTPYLGVVCSSPPMAMDKQFHSPSCCQQLSCFHGSQPQESQVKRMLIGLDHSLGRITPGALFCH